MSMAKRTIFTAPKCATRRQILIAGMGTSPAVLPETVWALACQKKSKASLKDSLAAFTVAQKSLMNSSFGEATDDLRFFAKEN